jgi:hypothetical protein
MVAIPIPLTKGPTDLSLEHWNEEDLVVRRDGGIKHKILDPVCVEGPHLRRLGQGWGQNYPLERDRIDHIVVVNVFNQDKAIAVVFNYAKEGSTVGDCGRILDGIYRRTLRFS